MKSWFDIKNLSKSSVSINLHGQIGGYGVQVSEFKKQIDNAGDIKSINLDVHSPGGNLLDGLAMYNILKTNKAKVNAFVSGAAASAASLALMAADVISIPKNAWIMIHNPHGVVAGESEDLRQYADLMDRFGENAVDIYSQRTSIERDKIIEMLDNETWISGEEAVDLGFADILTDEIKIASHASDFEGKFLSMPDFNQKNIEEISNIKEFERYLRDLGGVSRADATKLASRAKAIFKGDPEKLPDVEYSGLETALMRFTLPKQLT